MEPPQTPTLDALRVQAAAVAAQQAALGEQELRLEQRRVALERHEAQLAAHLADRRKQLLELQEQVKRQQAEARDHIATARQELDRTGTELVEARRAVDAERGRLLELRRRMKARFHKHWREREAKADRQVRELEAARQRLRDEEERLKRDRDAFDASRRRLNGEVELRTRQLHDGQFLFDQARKQWAEKNRQESEELGRLRQEVEGRSAALTAAERALGAEQAKWRQMLAHLRAEAAGLETRVKNQRQQLGEARPAAPITAAPDVPPRPEVPADAAELLAVLRRVADDLADQRVHLAEQWGRLLQTHERWGGDREAAQRQMETAAAELEAREALLAEREDAVRLIARQWLVRQEEVSRARARLESWQARLATREADGKAERAALLDDVKAREEAATALHRRLNDRRRVWLKRAREAAEARRESLRQCDETRREYAQLWEECRQRRDELTQAQRALASRSLAVERRRLEVLGRSSNAAAAEKRLARLERKAAAWLDEAGREVSRDREMLAAEARRLAERAKQLSDKEQVLATRREEFVAREAEWEKDQAAAVESEDLRRQEVYRLQARGARAEQHAAELQAEVERLALALLDEPETPAVLAAA